MDTTFSRKMTVFVWLDNWRPMTFQIGTELLAELLKLPSRGEIGRVVVVVPGRDEVDYEIDAAKELKDKQELWRRYLATSLDLCILHLAETKLTLE